MRFCGGSGLYEHKRRKEICKVYGGGSICDHNRIKSRCKDCGGSQICEHYRIKSQRKGCGGGSICEHNRIKSTCKDCRGSQICEHNRIKSTCKDRGGSSVCHHNRRKSQCKDCGGGQICKHNRIKSACKDCGGSQICEHSRRKTHCKDCNSLLYSIQLQRKQIYRIMKQTSINKTKPSIEYLGCSVEYFREYIKSKMVEGMTFNNIHYDHIKPINAFNLENQDELLNCCHYTNFQPLLAVDNLCKNCRWSENDEKFWKENIFNKEYLPLYMPL